MAANRRGPLAGEVVLDLSRVLAGPLATMNLGDLGAEVIKVERLGSGDDTRSWGPPFSDGMSTYFQSVNRNKRSVELDLAEPAGRAAALRLTRRADVVVENFSVGTLERLGLGWDVLHELNPRLVLCSISGFGRDGGAGLAGYDLLIQACGGLMSITGDEIGPPLKAGVAVVDVLAGLYATIGILAALRVRDATGLGQRVDVNLLSSLLAGLVNQASAAVCAGVAPGRSGNRHPSIVPYETFEACDGTLALAVGNDRQFHSLCDVLKVQELAADPRFATNTSRVANRDALGETLSRLFAEQSVESWVRRLTAASVPCGPVNDIASAFALADQLGLRPVQELTRSDGARSPQVSNPLEFSLTPVSYRLAPPLLGEHNSLLEGSRAELDARRARAGDEVGPQAGA